VIDMVQGNTAADLRKWCAGADPGWIEGIEVVATDLAESYRAGLSPHLDHARRVADPFHVVRVANRCIDGVRRRVQNATLGHRGRKADPLYKIRKLLLTGTERVEEPARERMLLGLRAGDPDDEVLGAWLDRNPSVTSTWLRTARKPTTCWPSPSTAATSTPSPRSAPWARPWPAGSPRSWPASTPVPATAPPRA